MGNSELKKEQLLNLVNFYQSQLDVLDLMLNDMSNIDMSIVQKWLDDTTKYTPKFTKSYNSFDEQHYTQLDLRDYC